MSMKELIKVTHNNELNVSSVFARDLYDGLGLRLSDWSRWLKTNVEQNEFFVEGNDWVGFSMMRNGNETKDFAISLDFAKHIAMQARTEKSHIYRNYMIECEKKSQLSIPKTFAEALRLAADTQEALEKAQLQIEQDKPKVKFAEIVTESSNTRCVRVWVKSMKHEMNLKVGEREVFKWLVDNKYIFKDEGGYLPYAKYESNGLNYFTVVLDEINGIPIRALKITGNGVANLTEKVVSHFSISTSTELV
jgi:phage anti-repressor protein